MQLPQAPKLPEHYRPIYPPHHVHINHSVHLRLTGALRQRQQGTLNRVLVFATYHLRILLFRLAADKAHVRLSTEVPGLRERYDGNDALGQHAVTSNFEPCRNAGLVLIT